jgi:two-component system, OmpR family, sensor histidine kinase MprB
MTFRRRLVALSGLAVAIAVAAVSIVTYLLVRDQMRARVDDELKRDVSVAFAAPPDSPLQRGGPGTDRGHAALVPGGGRKATTGALRLFLPSGPLSGRSVYAELVDRNGDVIRPRGPRTDLGSRATAQEVATGARAPFFSDLEAEGVHLRVYTAQLEHGQAIQAAQSLDDVDATLRHLATILVIVSLGGIFLAGALGYLVSRAAVTPVERLRRAAEQVASTRDLSRRIAAGGNDELAALAASFNQMLEALQGSLDAQRQLVADASHELRTPLASMRTNVEVLVHSDLLTEDERDALLADVVDQLEELTDLVGDLIDLARDADHEQEPPARVRLDLILADVAERTAARNPSVAFKLELAPAWVRAVENRIERAVTNLLDNAVKWSPPGGEIEIRVAAGELVVRDHGPGIAQEDLPRVFDRFYRSASARGLPGSGLGLAIVRQVAESAGGSVTARNAPGGGALLVLSLPRVEAPDLIPVPQRQLLPDS